MPKYFEQYLQHRLLAEAEADKSSSGGSHKGGESVKPESREKEHTPEDAQKPFTYKPERPMDLPQGVMEIHKAFLDAELLGDIEAELKKAIPNGKAYHIDEVFGTDEKGNSKLAKVDPKMRKDLKVNKCKLFVVGGAVRDFLLSIFHQDRLHKTPKNWNLATDARPKIVQLILMNARPHPIKCKMKQLGVVTAFIDGEEYDIETFRDGAPAAAGKAGPDGAENSFVTYSTPARDAKRRDFRINSLRYDIEKEVVEDDVGGFGDIVESPPKLRPNDPDILKKEPHVAMRAMRLHGKINGGDHTTFDPSLAKGLSNFDLGSKVDRKRVRDEFMDGLKVADDQAKYIAGFANTGKPGKNLLQQVFPGLEVNGKLDIPNNTHPHVALALILSQNGPDKVEKVASALEKSGFQRDEINDVTFLLGLPKYNNPEQVQEFNQEMNEKARKLVPSAIRNYAKWARLSNKQTIDKLLEYKSQGRYPATNKADVTANATHPSQVPAARADGEKAAFTKFHGPTKNPAPAPAKEPVKAPDKAA